MTLSVKKKIEKGLRTQVDEATRLRFLQILDDLKLGNELEYTFEPGLNNSERAVVHLLCREKGMRSKSSGKGKERCVTVFRTLNRKGKERCVTVFRTKKPTVFRTKKPTVFRTKKPTDKKQKKEKKKNTTFLSFSEGTKQVFRDLFMRYPPSDVEQNEEIVTTHVAKLNKRRTETNNAFHKPSMNKKEIAKKVGKVASRVHNDPKLRQIAEQRTKLPIASFKDSITSILETNQVVLISGETGCGKTTQVPQYLLDHMWSKGEACKIVCTQPRRISAVSVAERISHERGEKVGDNIGYKIRMESKGGKQSSVMFCTNGILLRILVGKSTSRSNAESGDMNSKEGVFELTHIIVDEIHERDRFSDFILAILRDMLHSYPHLRLVLMSATFDAERFSQYFGGCPIIRVPGFTYPVRSYYLEDILSILKSSESNHLDFASPEGIAHDGELTEDYTASLDEAINLAWSSDEFNPLLDLISSDGTLKICNYQHSFSGLSSLMVFAGKGRVSDVCLLLSLGANCNLRAKDGRTAMDWAQQENKGEVVEIIKQHLEKANLKSAEEQELLEKYLSIVNPENIDIILIERLLRKICTDSEEGAILIFLPGWDDINKTQEKLLSSPFFKDISKFVVLSLHSKVPSAEQKKVFKRPPHGSRKIILSTNIAETSLTIDDVVYVIDSGRMKEKNYDPYNNVSTLQSSWVSKASAKQREGRAGRCQPGICYHLYSKTRAASLLEFQIPEIQRMPIEELCLQVKLLDPNHKIVDFLQKTLDSPISETINNAILVLQDIGALTLDEGLTELGEKLGSLPVHPSTSRMLFFSILMNCLDPALTLACVSNYRDPFILPMDPNEKKKALAAKAELASLYGGCSDQLIVIAAYDGWVCAKNKGEESGFCSKYFVSSSTMKMLSRMRKQLKGELIRYGFISQDASQCSVNARDPGILHAVLVAGLYPMVGKLLPPHRSGQRWSVQTTNGVPVRLHPNSCNYKLSFEKSSTQPLVIYDEITKGDGGMFIRNSSIVGPYPLLMLAMEIVVAPAENNECESDEDCYTSGNDKDGMELHMPSYVKREQRIMSNPDNTVSVVIDRWYRFETTALDVAQIYCLRERLQAAILFKVKYSNEVLPPALGASMHTIASMLSFDGLSGISPSIKSVDKESEIPSSVLKSLLTVDAPQHSPRNKPTRVSRNAQRNVKPNTNGQQESMQIGTDPPKKSQFQSPYEQPPQTVAGATPPRKSQLQNPSGHSPNTQTIQPSQENRMQGLGLGGINSGGRRCKSSKRRCGQPQQNGTGTAPLHKSQLQNPSLQSPNTQTVQSSQPTQIQDSGLGGNNSSGRRRKSSKRKRGQPPQTETGTVPPQKSQLQNPSVQSPNTQAVQPSQPTQIQSSGIGGTTFSWT